MSALRELLIGDLGPACVAAAVASSLLFWWVVLRFGVGPGYNSTGTGPGAPVTSRGRAGK